MIFKIISLWLFLIAISTSVFASNLAQPGSEAVAREIAANVVKVKTPNVEAVTHDNSTEVFMELDNLGKQPHELVAAYSPVAKQIQLHKTIKIKGLMQMRQVADIKIAPRHEQDLHAGGLHVMLINLEQPLVKGKSVPVILLFKDGSWIRVMAHVV